MSRPRRVQRVSRHNVQQQPYSENNATVLGAAEQHSRQQPKVSDIHTECHTLLLPT